MLRDFFEFSNFVKKIEELAEFAEKTMYLVGEIKKDETLLFKEYIHYSDEIIYLYFHEYEIFDDTIVSFNKTKRNVTVSNEHGSTKY